MAQALRDKTRVAKLLRTLKSQMQEVVIGQPEAIDLCIICLIAEGHLLIEDVPGVGKTTLAKAFARSLDLPLQRIQFTADMLPSDIVGLSIFDDKKQAFTFHPGPLFTQLLLTDEINRAEPRTQSALLEAMMERQVSVDGQIHALSRPFMVIATQNPVDFSGTYPLPDSQKDRFLFCLNMGYPQAEDELRILRSAGREERVDSLEAVLSTEDILALSDAVDGVYASEDILHYILRIAHKTRDHEMLQLGISTRATLDALRAAKARALYEGRDFVIPEDVKKLAVATFAHRIHVHSHSARTEEEILKEILEQIPVPQ